MANKFKIGDVVQLKSGSIVMTVNAQSVREADSVIVVWHDGKELKREVIHENALEIAELD